MCRMVGFHCVLVVRYSGQRLVDSNVRLRKQSRALAHLRIMKIAKEDIPERLNVPGAIARQELNFGDATGYGRIAGEYFSLKEGTDIAPLLKGLESDLCQCPHWGI